MTELLEKRFRDARRKYIASHFDQLNPEQQKAVLTTEGPLLLLAGAGSGKTTVLINRIANLIRYGCGSDTEDVPESVTEQDTDFLESVTAESSAADQDRADHLCAVRPAAPWSILAITFTNKAANEIKERLSMLLGDQAQDIWAMTFHSACCRILRRDIECMGYTRNFTIYDSSDSERLMKEVIRDMGLDDKTFPAKMVLSVIGREKDQMTMPQDLLDQAERTNDYRMRHIAKAYQKYQAKLLENNALDFDDLLCVTVRLLQENEDVRRFYQKKFRYILVDEYQDTNHAQYLLTSILAQAHQNICVVGDDDQSIYRFRGATVENILSFEKQYSRSRTILLEQNYRSTQMILNAANSVIANNVGRKGKKLWTSVGEGDPITIYEAADQNAEANYVADQIIATSKLRKADGYDLKDYAILYRTNAQSNALEYAMKHRGINYRTYGGMKFLERAEIKDMLAYMCVLANRTDDLRLKRIINNPPRGIGAKTVEAAERMAAAEGKPLYEIISHPDSYGPLEKSAKKLKQFTALIEGMSSLLDTGIALPEFYDELIQRTGYADMLTEKPTEENKTRLENIRELKSSINFYMENTDQPTLNGFLQENALTTDMDQDPENGDAIVMMTMHSAKGLEFPNVFLVGFEDGLFPGMRAIGDQEEMEEERRLCYVAITRAKKHLTITHARERMLYGRTSGAIKSRFLSEIPEECAVFKGSSAVRRSSWDYNTDYSAPQWDRLTARESKPGYLRKNVSPAEKQTGMNIRKGDMVQHAAFGKGMVLSVIPMGGDALLEIAFDDVGTKKLMEKTASVHMKKL